MCTLPPVIHVGEWMRTRFQVRLRWLWVIGSSHRIVGLSTWSESRIRLNSISGSPPLLAFRSPNQSCVLDLVFIFLILCRYFGVWLGVYCVQKLEVFSWRSLSWILVQPFENYITKKFVEANTAVWGMRGHCWTIYFVVTVVRIPPMNVRRWNQ